MLTRTISFQSPGNDNTSLGDRKNSFIDLEDNKINSHNKNNEKEPIPLAPATAESLPSPTITENIQPSLALNDGACSNAIDNSLHMETSFEDSIMSDILAYDLDDDLDNPNSSLLQTIENQALGENLSVNSATVLSSKMEPTDNFISQSNKQKKKKKKGNQKMKKVNLFDTGSVDRNAPNHSSIEVIKAIDIIKSNLNIYIT